MTIYYLYHKISPKGLNYLGSTRNKDPFMYPGNGKRWKNHLREHKITPSQVKTAILFETNNKEELVKMGLYYSKLYNVVESEDWANLIPESGDGVFKGHKLTEEHKRKIGLAGLGRKPSPETIEKIASKNRGRKNSDESKLRMSLARIGKPGHKHSPETIEKISKVKTGKNKKGIEVINTETGEKFDSVRRAAESCGISEITLYRQIRVGYEKCKFKFSDPNYRPAIRPTTKRGIKLSDRIRKKIKDASTSGKKVRNKLTGEIFKCIVDAAKSVNIKANTLTAQLYNKRKCQFEYL